MQYFNRKLITFILVLVVVMGASLGNLSGVAYSEVVGITSTPTNPAPTITPTIQPATNTPVPSTATATPIPTNTPVTSDTSPPADTPPQAPTPSVIPTPGTIPSLGIGPGPGEILQSAAVILLALLLLALAWGRVWQLYRRGEFE